MIHCTKCHSFVSDVMVTYNEFAAEVKKVEGTCWRHGKVDCSYDDFEDLGIDL